MNIQDSIINDIESIEAKVWYAAYSIGYNDVVYALGIGKCIVSMLLSIARQYLYCTPSDKTVVILTNALSCITAVDKCTLDALRTHEDCYYVSREDINL